MAQNGRGGVVITDYEDRISVRHRNPEYKRPYSAPQPFNTSFPIKCFLLKQCG
jgi:hypothetical protein